MIGEGSQVKPSERSDRTGSIKDYGVRIYSKTRTICNQLTCYPHAGKKKSLKKCRTTVDSNKLVYNWSVGQPDGATLLVSPKDVAQIREATRNAYQAYHLRLANPTSLPTLIRLNTLHAMSRNAALMGFWPSGLCKDDYISPYNDHGPRLPHQALPPAACPEALKPTTLQRTIVHHPWIDLFPFPNFRDRVLQALENGMLDDDELCWDVLETDGRDIDERSALIVWGDSSDPHAWEVNEAFLRKWGWLVWECRELLQATNDWRARRGERQLKLPDR
jgi:hypothetical protein